MANPHARAIAQPFIFIDSSATARGTGNVVFGSIGKDVQFFFNSFKIHSALEYIQNYGNIPIGRKYSYIKFGYIPKYSIFGVWNQNYLLKHDASKK